MITGLVVDVVHKHGPITYLHTVDEDGNVESLEFILFDDISYFDDFIKENTIYCNTVIGNPEDMFGTEVIGQPVRFTKMPGPIATYFVEPEGCSSYMIVELKLSGFFDKDSLDKLKENNND